jgi:hypothetical protein
MSISSPLAFFCAGALAGACLVYGAYRPLALAAGPPAASSRPPVEFSLDDEILSEALARNVQFFGREGQQRVSDAFVVVVGLGVRAQDLLQYLPYCCTMR